MHPASARYVSPCPRCGQLAYRNHEARCRSEAPYLLFPADGTVECWTWAELLEQAGKIDSDSGAFALDRTGDECLRVVRGKVLAGRPYPQPIPWVLPLLDEPDPEQCGACHGRGADWEDAYPDGGWYDECRGCRGRGTAYVCGDCRQWHPPEEYHWTHDDLGPVCDDCMEDAAKKVGTEARP